jgi:hypothetical protein
MKSKKKEILEMENKNQCNHALGTIGQTAKVIDRIHPCANCPMRLLAIQQPQSIFAGIHNWHKTWWPGWKAHQAREFACGATAKAHA